MDTPGKGVVGNSDGGGFGLLGGGSGCNLNQLEAMLSLLRSFSRGNICE